MNYKILSLLMIIKLLITTFNNIFASESMQSAQSTTMDQITTQLHQTTLLKGSTTIYHKKDTDQKQHQQSTSTTITMPINVEITSDISFPIDQHISTLELAQRAIREQNYETLNQSLKQLSLENVAAIIDNELFDEHNQYNFRKLHHIITHISPQQATRVLVSLNDLKEKTIVDRLKKRTEENPENPENPLNQDRIYELLATIKSLHCNPTDELVKTKIHLPIKPSSKITKHIRFDDSANTIIEYGIDMNQPYYADQTKLPQLNPTPKDFPKLKYLESITLRGGRKSIEMEKMDKLFVQKPNTSTVPNTIIQRTSSAQQQTVQNQINRLKELEKIIVTLDNPSTE